jgi:hypothetical protein
VNGNDTYSFSTGLREHLRARGWNATDLAARLHVDPSLVRRWLRGDRAPALGSDYVDRIAAVLELAPSDHRRLELGQIARLRARQSATTRLPVVPEPSGWPQSPTMGVGTDAYLEAEERSGDRVFVSECLSDLAVARAWLAPHSRWVREAGLPPERLERLLAVQRRRLANLRSLEGVVSVREICSRPALERFAREGVPVPGFPLGVARRHFEARERAELLMTAVETLEANPRYQIAVADDDVVLPSIAWGIRGDRAAFLWPGRRGDPPVWIAEPAIVAGFRHHFDQLWQQIPAPRRDRQQVARWLRQLADVVGR